MTPALHPARAHAHPEAIHPCRECGGPVFRAGGRCKGCYAAVRAMPIPDGFEDAARTGTFSALRQRFGLGKSTIARMLRDLGITLAGRSGRPAKPKPEAPPKPPRAVKNAPVRRARAVKPSAPFNRPVTVPTDRDHRAKGRADQAADHLRRYGPLWRCAPSGRPDPAGPMWRRGSAILSDADVIERATAKGWDPLAWKALTPSAPVADPGRASFLAQRPGGGRGDHVPAVVTGAGA